MPKIIDESQVFKAVLQVVMERGYDNATTAEMAAAANIHEATLFRKYDSKARLVELAIENQLTDAPLSKVSYSGNLQEDLIAILQAYIDTFNEHGAIIPTILLEIPRHPELSNTLHIPMANVKSILKIIERYQHDGVLKDESSLLMVSVLLGPIMLHHILRQTSIALLTTEISLEDYVEGFLRGRMFNSVHP